VGSSSVVYTTTLFVSFSSDSFCILYNRTNSIRYNSALSQTLPLSSPRIVIVTPEFLSGGLIDVEAAKGTAIRRSSLKVIGRQQMSPAKMINSTLGGLWGDGTPAFDPNNNMSGNLSEYRQFQEDYDAKRFPKLLSAVECLTKYLNPTANRSDMIMVSTYDTVMHMDLQNATNNTLLYEYGAFGFDGPGNYWECGVSNTFDCRKPELWKHNTSLVKDWNVYGYR
jgi:hypothetical protein